MVEEIPPVRACAGCGNGGRISPADPSRATAHGRQAPAHATLAAQWWKDFPSRSGEAARIVEEFPPDAGGRVSVMWKDFPCRCRIVCCVDGGLRDSALLLAAHDLHIGAASQAGLDVSRTRGHRVPSPCPPPALPAPSRAVSGLPAGSADQRVGQSTASAGCGSIGHGPLCCQTSTALMGRHGVRMRGWWKDFPCPAVQGRPRQGKAAGCGPIAARQAWRYGGENLDCLLPRLCLLWQAHVVSFERHRFRSAVGSRGNSSTMAVA